MLHLSRVTKHTTARKDNTLWGHSLALSGSSHRYHFLLIKKICHILEIITASFQLFKWWKAWWSKTWYKQSGLYLLCLACPKIGLRCRHKFCFRTMSRLLQVLECRPGCDIVIPHHQSNVQLEACIKFGKDTIECRQTNNKVHFALLQIRSTHWWLLGCPVYLECCSTGP